MTFRSRQPGECNWRYSSARNYSGDNAVVEIDIMGSKIENRWNKIELFLVVGRLREARA